MSKPIVLIASLFLAGCAGPRPSLVRDTAPAAPVVEKLTGPAGTLTVTRIGHSMMLLQSGDHAILTDPWFTYTGAYDPGEKLGMGIAQLPKLTAIVSSHGHYDHYDPAGFTAYPDKAVPWVVRAGTGPAATQAGFTDVRELEHWGTTEVAGIQITATPGHHSVPQNTYVIEMDGFTIFFGGDSTKIPELDEIPKKLPPIDLAIVAVNGLSAVGTQHVMNAEQAAEVVGMLGAKVAVPNHYRFHGNWFTEAFILSYDGTPERFVEAAKKSAATTKVFVLEPGDPLVIERAP